MHQRKLKRKGRISMVESLEVRVLLSAAFDITGLTSLRNDPAFSTITGQGVGIAVLDTGVDAANPDLSSNVVAFYNAVENPVDTANLAVSNAVDNVGHGSHVSGIAASSNPSIGVAYGAKLVDIKVLADSGESQLGGDPLLRGLEWVANNYLAYNIRVVNMSLGEPGVNENNPTTGDNQNAETVEIKDLENLGITVVSASGNSYANYATAGESFPAIVSTIGVANTWADAGQASDFGVPFGENGDQYYAVDSSATPDTLASTSQRSSNSNQLAAPGEDIYSTWNGTVDSSNGTDTNHNTLSGTSMATPFVSGVVALMQDASEYFGGHYISSTSEIVQILQQTSDTIVDSNNPNNSRYDSSTNATSTLPETGLSFKRVNVLKAIEAVEATVTGGVITTGPRPGPDTDNSTSTATPVNNINGTALATFTGNIGNDGLVQIGANDVDLYQLNITSPGKLTITLTQPSSGTAFAATLRLFDSSGNLITSATGVASGYPAFTNANPLAVGTYYLGVSSAGNVNYTVNGTGAAGGSTTGDYSLRIQLINPDPNGTIQGAATVDLTVPNDTETDPNTGATYTDVLQQGELGSDPPPQGSSTRISVSDDVDMFKMEAPDNGTLSLDAASAFGDVTFLEVFDASGKSLATANGANLLGVDNTLSLQVTGGTTYYVAMTVPANAGLNPSNPYLGRTANSTPSNQNYNLYLRFNNKDIDGTALNANLDNIGTAISAAVGNDNGIAVGANGSKDVDWYSYTAGQDGLFDVTAQSTTSNFTPIVTLWEYTPGQTDIVKVADTSTANLFSSPADLFSPSSITPPGGMGSGHLILQVSSGETFFVAITGQGNSNFNWYALASGSGGQTGNYSLTTKLDALNTLSNLSDNSIQTNTPQTISVGQTINANIGSDGALVIGPTDVDMYKLVAPATETLDIRTNTSQEGDADTVLRVFDSSGNQLAANDNIDSTTTASEVHVSVQKGQTYYIGVDGAGPNALGYNPLTGANAGSGSTGNYGLSVGTVAPGFSVSPAAPVADFTGATEIFTVALSAPLGVSATIDYATSDGTAVAGTDYTATSGTLTFAPGQTSQAVSVPVLTNTKASVGDVTFTLTLSNASGAPISTGSAAGTIQDVPVTTMTFSAGKPITYIDSLNKNIKLSLIGPGTGTAVFINGGLDPAEISVADTTGATTFAILGSTAIIGGVSISGSLEWLDGKGVTLNGGVTVTGTLSKLTLGNVNGSNAGATISIGAAGPPTVIALGLVTDMSLSSVGAIASLTTNDWLNSAGGAVDISASSIGPITIKGDFAPSINVSSLGSVKIAGSLTGGIWAVSGSGQNIQVNGDANAGWTAVFGGSLGVVHVANDAGNLTASTIKTFKVSGSLSSATLTLTGAGNSLGGLMVGQSVSASTIETGGSVGKVTVGSFINSSLLIGVSAALAGLAGSPSDFATNATLASFSVTGNRTPAFANSYVEAETIGKVSLAKVNPSNGGTPFGIAAHSLTSFIDKGVLKWTNKEPVALLIPYGDLAVQIV